MAESIGDLAVEDIERFRARRGHFADLASHGLVLARATSSIVHGLDSLGLLDTRHLVAFGDERVGESTESDLGKAGVSVVAFHVGQAELANSNHCVLMIQLIEFANLFIETFFFKFFSNT